MISLSPQSLQADAAKSQADTTKTIAEAAKSQAENTRNLALAATDQVTKLAAGVRESHALVKATQDTLSEMRKNFVREQRPYMLPRPDAVVFEKGQRLKWNIHFVNYGRVPAMHARTCIILIYGRDAMSTAASYTEDDILKGCKTSSSGSGLIESDAPAPPGDSIFATALSKEILGDDADIAYLRDADLRVVVRSLVTYEDISGNHYTTLSCNAHLASGAVVELPRGK